MPPSGWYSACMGDMGASLACEPQKQLLQCHFQAVTQQSFSRSAGAARDQRPPPMHSIGWLGRTPERRRWQKALGPGAMP